MPKWTKSPDALVARFVSLVEALPGVETRKMFGYPASFILGQMFCGLFQSSMFLRLDEQGRSQMTRDHGAASFEPMPGRPMREYVVVPEGLLSSGTALATWLKRSRDYAASLPPKEKGPPKTIKRQKRQV